MLAITVVVVGTALEEEEEELDAVEVWRACDG